MAELYRKSSIDKLSNPEQLDRTITISSPLSWLALLGIAIIIVTTIIWSIWGTIPTMVTVNGIFSSPTNSCTIFTDYAGTVSSILKKAGDSVNKGDEVAKIKTSDGKEKIIVAPDDGIISTVLVAENTPTFVGSELFRYAPRLGVDQVVVCYVPSAFAGQLKKDMKVLLYPTSVDTQKSGHMEASIESIGKYSANTVNMGYVLGENNLVTEQFASQGPVVAVICRIKTDSSTKSGYWWSSDNGKDTMISNGTFLSAKIVVDESAPITKLFNGLKEQLEG